MDNLTFTLATTSLSDSARVQLRQAPDTEIGQDAWDQFAEEIKVEPTLIHYPSDALRRRWEDGYAAATVVDGRVISYICLAPIYFESNRDRFAAALDISADHLPDIDVYEFTTAWTAPAWRRRGISSQMRPPLLERFFQAEALGISGMAGLASPVLAKLGWQIVGWSRIAFTTSFTGVPLNGYCEETDCGWRPPSGLERYEGNHVPLEDTSHPWSKFAYFWTSNVSLARALNDGLKEAVRGNLHRWRQVVVNVFSVPQELHRVAFLD